MSITLLLLIAAFVVTILAMIGRARVDIAVLLVILAALMEHLPK